MQSLLAGRLPFRIVVMIVVDMISIGLTPSNRMAAREKLRLCGRRSRPHCGLLASQTQIPPFLSL